MVYQSNSIRETFFCANNVVQKFNQKKIIALIGELGTGKTTFAQGFAKALKIQDKIISPTFVLIRQHQIPKSIKVFYHIDLYRIEGDIDINHLGLNELFDDQNAIILIEWAQKLGNQLPSSALKIFFEKTSETGRSIKII